MVLIKYQNHVPPEHLNGPALAFLNKRSIASDFKVSNPVWVLDMIFLVGLQFTFIDVQ